MNSSSLTDKVQLDLLRDNYVMALALYKYSHSIAALTRLNDAKDAYVLFKLDQVTILKSRDI
jgi:hypothetical protein